MIVTADIKPYTNKIRFKTKFAFYFLMERHNTSHNTSMVGAPAILPYVRLAFHFSIREPLYNSPCLILVQDNDVRCMYDYFFPLDVDQPVCVPVNEEFTALINRLKDLRYKRIQLESDLRAMGLGFEKHKKKEDVETEISKLDAEIKEVESKITKFLMDARGIACNKIFDKIFDFTVLPYLRSLNISNEEEQKIREAWRTAISLVRTSRSSIPVSIPQGFLLLYPPVTHFTVELYTTFNYELLTKYYSSLRDYFSKMSQLSEGCVRIAGSVIPLNEVMQQILQSLISFTAPRRDP